MPTLTTDPEICLRLSYREWKLVTKALSGVTSQTEAVAARQLGADLLARFKSQLEETLAVTSGALEKAEALTGQGAIPRSQS